MATTGAPMPMPAFAPVLSPPLLCKDGVEDRETVAEIALEAPVFVLGPVLDVEAIELVELDTLVEVDELVVVALDEILNAPETATGLVSPW